MPNGTAALGQDFVAFYVDRCKEAGYHPIGSWKNALGNQAKRLVREKKPQELIEEAIGVVAAERKMPGTLVHVVVDLEAALAERLRAV